MGESKLKVEITDHEASEEQKVDSEKLDRVTSLLLLLMYAHEEAGRLECADCQTQLRLGAKSLVLQYNIMEPLGGAHQLSRH